MSLASLFNAWSGQIWFPNAMAHHDAEPRLTAMQDCLLTWFQQSARNLPWRHTRNPYHILVAEVMLQQTQVDRVIPRYHQFLNAFPTLEHLAAAPTAAVIKEWSGLGYNRRAVNLQRVARIIMTDHQGSFPQEVKKLKELPGIGAYTAGAIACFAFEQDIAFMDTNIRRVVQRCLVGPDDTTAPRPQERHLLALARSVIPPGRGWHWNQAIMELGALVCTAASPACWRCPLRDHCLAYAAWKQRDEQTFQHSESEEQSAPLMPYSEQSGQPASYSHPPKQTRARRVAERPTEPFIGSNRYYRGRLIALLRTLPPQATLSRAQIGPKIKDNYDEHNDADWLHHLLEGLIRDGLVELVDDEVRLPLS